MIPFLEKMTQAKMDVDDVAQITNDITNTMANLFSVNLKNLLLFPNRFCKYIKAQQLGLYKKRLKC
jgi:hypothetical protein